MLKLGQTVVLLNVLVFDSVLSKIIIPVNNNFTSSYVHSLIDSENLRDFSRNHDVALIRLEKKFKSNVFDNVIDVLSKALKMNAVFVHSLPDSIPPYRTHAFSFFVIFSDIQNHVMNYS